MPSLADYEVLEKVGQGAQGVVHRAIQRSTGTVVALKQIDVSDMTTKERIAALAEVKVLASLAEDPHPCVVTYVESFVDQGLLCIALQWSASGTLQDALNARQGGGVSEEGKPLKKSSSSSRKPKDPFDEREIWNFFLSIALGLEHIHRHAVLHRDVKMANVFLHERTTNDHHNSTAEEEPSMTPLSSSTALLPRIQIGDFGVSTILDDRSRARTMVGTPYYLSPELCMGKAYSQKSDVWSLGVILYVLLNQKMPFEASNYAALILRIVQEEHAKHTQLAMSKYSPALKRMATWCMQKEESRRPTSRELISHPDCLGTALRLGLPVPEDVIEAMCYRPPVAQPAPSSQHLPSIHSSSTARAGTSLAAVGSVAARPTPSLLPNRQPNSIPSKRKVRVVTGVANGRPVVPTAAVVSTPTTVGSVLNQGGYAPPPSFAAQLRGGPAGGTGRTTSAPRGANNNNNNNAAALLAGGGGGGLPRPPRTAGAEAIRSVRQLPKYHPSGGGAGAAGEDSSDDDKTPAQRSPPPPPAPTQSSKHPSVSGSSPLLSAKAADAGGGVLSSVPSPDGRKLYSYEKRIQSVERLQRLKEEAEEQAYSKYGAAPHHHRGLNSGGGGELSEDSYRRYLAHVREEEERRVESRRGVPLSSVDGGGVARPATTSTDQTLVLLSRHDLLPSGWEAEAHEALRRSREEHRQSQQQQQQHAASAASQMHRTHGVAVKAKGASSWNVPGAQDATFQLPQHNNNNNNNNTTSTTVVSSVSSDTTTDWQDAAAAAAASPVRLTTSSQGGAPPLQSADQRYQQLDGTFPISESGVPSPLVQRRPPLSVGTSSVRTSSSVVEEGSALRARMRETIARASLTGGSVEIDAALALLLEQEELERLQQQQQGPQQQQNNNNGGGPHRYQDAAMEVEDETGVLSSPPRSDAYDEDNEQWEVDEEIEEEEQQNDEESWLPSRHFAVAWRVAGEGEEDDDDETHKKVEEAAATATESGRRGWNSSHALPSSNPNDLTHGEQRARRKNSQAEGDNETTRQLETFDTTQDITAQAHALFEEGETLLGTVPFAEVIEALTRSTPLDSQQLTDFIAERVDPKGDPKLVQEVMYLTFRYVMLEGEKKRMRRNGDED